MKSFLDKKMSIFEGYGAFNSRNALKEHKRPGPGVTFFFVLNSAEQEFFPANKSKIMNSYKYFLPKHSSAWKFLC